jgi:23S rRNA pseudouridine2605 synthase
MKKFSKSRSAYPAKKSSPSAKPVKSYAGAKKSDSKNRGAHGFKSDRPAKKYTSDSKAENKSAPYGKPKFTQRKNAGTGTDEFAKPTTTYSKKTGYGSRGGKKFGSSETNTSRNKPTPYGKPKFTKRKDAGASSEEFNKPTPAYSKRTAYDSRGGKKFGSSETNTSRNKPNTYGKPKFTKRKDAGASSDEFDKPTSSYTKKPGYSSRGDKKFTSSDRNTDRYKTTRQQDDSRYKKTASAETRGRKERTAKSDTQYRSGARKKHIKYDSPIETEAAPVAGKTRLNKFIANAGICSRRDADNLITAGLVSVNGKIITEMGYQVNAGDDVRYNGTRLNNEKKVYLIMNKTRDTITTLDDPEGRKTVTEALAGSGLPRVYPVGRLDRNTTGVLLLTNDGEMAQRLMHPKYEVQKIYKATLDKNLKGQDLWTISNGIELEDGPIKPDSIAVPNAQEKNVVVIEIHSGRNRIIHRTFEHLGYKVDKLDRIWYAGFDKRALKRGQWRELNDRELTALKKLVKLK